ncbi:meiotic recombination protein REC8 homolog [Conger conger]|uniref:meiotic recombination protein REC8 homolog n=1 Tax=Conger conger TaxID=82655 RepID=UPI002A5A82D8|nr:meiotic recombination protein REC8 homolog [Conger conger]
MFYYPNVLQYRTGCFSTVWLAATKAIKISRRDYLKVNVQRTCGDIMDYVLVRAPPLQPGLPRPRFSLYLSFQLQYGIIIVYHRQCTILLEEIQHIIDRLLRSTKKLKIDLVEPDRLALNVPDSLSMLEESERALDPFFGVLGYTLPSPSVLMQQWQVPEEESPPRPLVERHGTPQRDRITASPESITLVEREPVAIPAAVVFEGVDLPVVTPSHMDIIDMLMEQQDQFPGEVEEREQEREAERAREQQQTTVSTVQLGVTEVTPEDLALLPEKEAGPPAETPTAPPPSPPLETTPLETSPLSVIPLPSSPEREGEREAEEPAASRRERELAHERERRGRKEGEGDTSAVEPEPAAPARKQRRRRQLLFIDPQTQIPPEELQDAIQDPLTETQSLKLVQPPSRQSVSPEELLSNPCTALHPDILDLWKKGAFVMPLLSVAARKRLAEEETELEKESVGAVEEVRVKDKEERVEDKGVREEISPKEVPRELAESGLPQPEVSVSIELMGEVSDRDVSHLIIPESRGSPTGEILFPLEDIPEEGVRPAEREIEQVPMTRANLMGMLWRPFQEQRNVLFHSLLPPLADRSTASRSFSTLLECVSARILSVEQDEPYGSIIIAQGPLYEQEGGWAPHAD